MTGELVNESNEYVDGNEMVYNATFNDYEKVCKTCTLYVVFLIMVLIIIMGIGGACLYFY